MSTSVNIIAIDPGCKESGWVHYIDGRVHQSGINDNREILKNLCTRRDEGMRLAIEMIASYGMPVGKEVFDTCVWIGRFKQAWHVPEDVQFVLRMKVKMHLCHNTRASDANIRQALIDMHEPTGGGATPQIGTKSNPGPLYGVTSHQWSALGVAITAKNELGDLL